MILTRIKAALLLQKLDNFCKENNLKVATKGNGKYIGLAKIVMRRYKYVILVTKHTKFICNNPKFLKKWALKESVKHISPLSYR